MEEQDMRPITESQERGISALSSLSISLHFKRYRLRPNDIKTLWTRESSGLRRKLRYFPRNSRNRSKKANIVIPTASLFIAKSKVTMRNPFRIAKNTAPPPETLASSSTLASSHTRSLDSPAFLKRIHPHRFEEGESGTDLHVLRGDSLCYFFFLEDLADFYRNMSWFFKKWSMREVGKPVSTRELDNLNS